MHPSSHYSRSYSQSLNFVGILNWCDRLGIFLSQIQPISKKSNLSPIQELTLVLQKRNKRNIFLRSCLKFLFIKQLCHVLKCYILQKNRTQISNIIVLLQKRFLFGALLIFILHYYIKGTTYANIQILSYIMSQKKYIICCLSFLRIPTRK